MNRLVATTTFFWMSLGATLLAGTLHWLQPAAVPAQHVHLGVGLTVATALGICVTSPRHE